MSLFQPTHPLCMLRTGPCKLMLASHFPKGMFFQLKSNSPVRTLHLNVAVDKNIELVSCVLCRLIKRAENCRSDSAWESCLMSTDHPRTEHSASDHAIHIYRCLWKCSAAPWGMIDGTFQKRLLNTSTLDHGKKKAGAWKDSQLYIIFNHHAQIAWRYSMGKHQKIKSI